jgi:Tfp pilus assembly protein PilN
MSYPELNLARRPFRDYRLFTAVVVLLYAAAVAVTALSVRGVVRGLSVNEATQARIAELDQGIREAKGESEALRKELSGVDFQRLHGAALAVNDLIGRRAFSWSRILERLERVLPDDVRLVALGTTQDAKGGGVAVRLTCITPVRDGMIRAFAALRDDPAFDEIVPGNFSDEEFSSAHGKKFDLTARFREVQP